MTSDSGPNPEPADMTRRSWIGLAMSLPVLALEMGSHFTGLHRWFGPQNSNGLQLVLAAPVVLWGGWPGLTAVSNTRVGALAAERASGSAFSVSTAGCPTALPKLGHMQTF